MNEKSCQNCIEYKKGDCLGQNLCELYQPSPSVEAKEYWPTTMRSRYSYAGYDASDYSWTKATNRTKSFSQKYQSKISWTKAELQKMIDFHKKCYENPGSADVLLRYFEGEVVAWISYDSIKDNVNYRFKAKCLLQLGSHILVVNSENSEKKTDKALRRGVYEVARQIKKPCIINLIVDRDLFSNNESRLSLESDDPLNESIKLFRDLGCKITEIIIKDGFKMIRDQINNPKTEITEPKVNECKPVYEDKKDIVNAQADFKPVLKVSSKYGVMTQDDALKLQKVMNSGKNKESGIKEVHPTSQYDKPDTSGGIQIRCRVCDNIFIMSPSEVNYYRKKGLQMPKRCKACIDKGVRYSDADYYDRGLKHNSYQNSLDVYGPRINVNGGLENSPGYRLAEDKNGKSTYVRNFGGKTEVIKKRHV